MVALSRSQQIELYRIESFQTHLAYVARVYLEPWAALLGAAGGGPAAESRLAVIVDDRPTPHLRSCVLNTLLMGRLGWRVKWFTSPQALAASRQLVADLGPWVEVIGIAVDGAEALSWQAYNTLLKDPQFWRMLETERVLTFQVDTLLIEPPEEEVFAYDYVGSPWARGRILSMDFPIYSAELELQGVEWESRALCGTTPQGVINGNGGLSVRHCERMAEIAERCSSPPEEPEDIFFARCLAAVSIKAVLPPLPVVQRFSCETQAQRCSGAHAAWRYLAAGEVAELLERHLKQVMALTAIGVATSRVAEGR
ncbi:hypothetical protein KBY86_13115 [Synechococcus sp. Lug-A]|uniref:DUF5672 family protein n=1 Tax=Synechococcus sp. Lug-A TaxID=2823740 RepID=UPI0020CDDEFD|nr:DUF5672 family protein [Synechococcus sp. Lug-A]MCP9847820.1 hypothetical protein [Synechococcus sp. Lug-A]